MTYYQKTVSLLLFLYILSSSTSGQAPPASLRKIPAELLRQDLRILIDSLKKDHPGLYRYRTREDMNGVFDSCLASIHDSMTATDFYALACYLIASIEDGHTNCKLPRQVMNDYKSTVKLFPAFVLFIHNRAFIYCCKQYPGLAGAELLSIDYHPMEDITRRLFSYIPSDGSIQSRKNWEIGDGFPFFYNFLYGAANSFTIRYQLSTGEKRSATLQADLLDSFICPPPFKRPTDYLQLTYQPGKIALLTIKTFYDGFLQQTNENFGQFLDSAFKDLKEKGVQKLIIDLRSNQGGNDENGSLLYAYLSQQPFRYYASLESTTGKFPESRHTNLSLQFPRSNNYKGKVWFLIDGRSFSATAEFAAVARSNDRGLFVGEETGGGYYGNTSGSDATVNLPNTHISCRIPMVKYTLAVKQAAFKDRGILPDHEIYRSIQDILTNKDSQLEYAFRQAERDDR